VKKVLEEWRLGYPTFVASQDASRASDRKIAGYPVGIFPYYVLVDSQGNLAGHGSLRELRSELTENGNREHEGSAGKITSENASRLTPARTNPNDRQARLAEIEPEFGKIYRLSEDEVLRHIPEPLNRKLRLRWYNAVFVRSRTDEMEIVTLYVQWKDGRPQWKGATVGSGKGGMPIRAVLRMLNAVPSQDIRGEDNLLNRRVPGDWVFDPNAPPEKVVAAMQPVLRKEWGVPVTLEFREVERDVYVVRGGWAFEPISNEFPEVQVYGSHLNKDSGAGGACGNFEAFLRQLGSWIDMPVVNEVPQPPNRLCWLFHIPSPFTQQQWGESHDPEKVTSHITEQTGLEFVKKRRKTRMLLVERPKDNTH